MGTYDRHDGTPISPNYDEGPISFDDEVYNEIDAELTYQYERWGIDADDTKNTPNDFVSYISHHSTRWFNGGFAPYDKQTTDTFRKQMIKTAALAIAAVQSLDRQRAANGRAFYETELVEA